MEALTAYHEAGHAIAHHRLDIEQDLVSIRLDRQAHTLGRSISAGVKHCWSKSEAADMAIAYCAGYAAVLAAGHSEEAALGGCEDDFEHVLELISFWELGDLEFESFALRREASHEMWVRELKDNLRALSTEERRARTLKLLNDPWYVCGKKLTRTKDWACYSHKEKETLSHHHVIGLALKFLDEVDAEELERLPFGKAWLQAQAAIARAARGGTA